MSAVSMPARASTWWRRSSVPDSRTGGLAESTRSRPSMSANRVRHSCEGSSRPAAISASASSRALRRAVPGARTWAGSSSGRRNGSPAHASASAASAGRPGASKAVVRCSEISCMGAARRRAALREDRPQETASSPGEYRNGGKAYLVTMADRPAQLTEEQIAELRGWADSLLRNGANGDLETFARAIGPLADEAERLRRGSSTRRPAALASLRREASEAVDNGAAGEVRAAARGVLLLCDDIAAGRAAARARETARRRRTLYAVAGSVALVGLASFFAFSGGAGGLDATGPEASLLGRDALSALAFTVVGDADDLGATTWLLDGQPVTARVAAR